MKKAKDFLNDPKMEKQFDMLAESGMYEFKAMKHISKIGNDKWSVIRNTLTLPDFGEEFVLLSLNGITRNQFLKLSGNQA